ncbi:MAG: DNA-binding transcriptional LysR family regulator [Polaribacter sp.]|jgi:DNA-binding transcriptional LysR family regulator|tara:strand:- start:7547 stop:8422 length:876 start_codon:yes stop_codon:yes gene_type:complete
MDNQNLSAFIKVAETNSFSEAAFLLDVTQSTISKRIALLESKIGKRLFDRIARRVTLTEAGTELLPRARLILKEYESALQAINDLSGRTSGVLRLAISHHLGLHRLPPLLKSYAQQHSDVILDIEFMDSEKAYEQVLHGHSEIAVITLALERHPNVVSQKIWNDPLNFICAHDHPLARIAFPTLNDIAEFPVILPGLNTYTGRIVQKLFQTENIPLKSTMSTNYLETISTMVEVGLGWSVLPETLAKQLHVMPFNHTEMQRDLGYICHTKRTLSNAAKAFIQLLNAEVTQY